MISITGTTGNYILQPSLMEMHHDSLEWLSTTMLWKRETSFFQKLLDKYSQMFKTVEEKKKMDHFQNLIIYYSGELIDAMRKKLRDHEKRLARMLLEKNESDTQYYKEHKGVMEELGSFGIGFRDFKHDLFDFVEPVM